MVSFTVIVWNSESRHDVFPLVDTRLRFDRGSFDAQLLGIGTNAPPVNAVRLFPNAPKNSEHSEEGYEWGAILF